MKLPSGQSKLDVMQRKILRMKQDLAREFKSVMYESFANFFQEHHTVKSLSWEQFTPFFNDGDDCYFSYHELTYYPCVIEIDGKEIHCGEPGMGHAWWKTPAGKDALKDIKSLDSLLSRFEYELEECFGDHCRVIATATNFEVEEVDHH